MQKYLRWLVGGILILVSIVSIVGLDVMAALAWLAGGLILLPPSAGYISEYIRPLARPKMAWTVGFILLALGSILSSKEPATEQAPAGTIESASPPTVDPAPQPVITEPAVQKAEPPVVDPVTKIAEHAVSPIGGPGEEKTRKLWGPTWLARINKLLPRAAIRIAASSECDRLEVIGLSEQRSEPRKHIVFFADCANQKRFYVSEEEAESSVEILSKNSKTSHALDEQAILECESQVKAVLPFPKTFNRRILETSVYRAPTGNIAVSFGFSAENALGATLSRRAKCVIDDAGISPAELTTGVVSLISPSRPDRRGG